MEIHALLSVSPFAKRIRATILYPIEALLLRLVTVVMSTREKGAIRLMRLDFVFD